MLEERIVLDIEPLEQYLRPAETPAVAVGVCCPSCRKPWPDDGVLYFDCPYCGYFNDDLIH